VRNQQPSFFIRQSKRARSATLLILLVSLLILACVGSISADSRPMLVSPNANPEEETPACQSCHPEAFAEWEGTPHANATSGALFQAQLAKVENQAVCLSCHATGFDMATGHYEAAGVTCTACHSAYNENHPADALMDLPRASETCGECHRPTFREWQDSSHAQENIECFDCHKVHSQELRLESYDRLCAACHDDQKTELAHAAHDIEGGACSSCHMTHEVKDSCTIADTEVSISDHSFGVSASVCSQCHTSAIAGTVSAMPGMTDTNVDAEFDRIFQQADRVPLLEKQVTDLQERMSSLQNLSVIGIGLALGGGGFLGLVAGLGILALRGRNQENDE
jgi:hypothetical protein